MIHLINFNKKISNEQKMIIESTKKFCKSYLQPRVINDYKNEIIDRKIFKEFGNMGILGPTIKGFSCLGENYLTYGLISKEIESIDSGYRSMFSVQSSLVMNPIYKYANDKLKNKYIPMLASGDFIGCFGLTEPDAGSNPNSMKTNAIRDGNNYILNGSKTWISNSPIADVFIIWAKLEDKVHGFLLDRDMEGISTPKIDGKLSLRTSITGMIFLDNVKVPIENKLDIEGLRGPFSCLNDARLGISFGSLGAAETCLHTTIDYVLNRKQFNNELLAEKQLIQYKLADMVSEYNLALNSCYSIAESVDENDYKPEMISFVKRNSCQKSLIIARTCRDMLGGNGISEEYNVFRHLTNLETVNTYEGTHDIHSLILGKYITNKIAF
jgi:glutaryl-CoA dehydrogenase|tara:strand:+ start:433 stop:1581 length:1149 start_codon:yes stop_codon:yes gene_type:complete